MSVERQETRNLGIRAEITQSLKELLQRNSNLAEMVSDAVREDKLAVTPEVQAALGVIRELSLLSLTMVAAHAEVIFPEEVGAAKSVRQKPSTAFVAGEVKARGKSQEVSERKTSSKTFGDLLIERITAQFPSGKRTVTKKEIAAIAKKTSAVKKAIAAEKLPARQAEFTRNEASRIIMRVLTTPRKDFKAEKAYNRTQVINRFGISPKQLDELSSLAGFDWEQNPTVDAATALQIRGLAQLDKTSSKRRKKS